MARTFPTVGVSPIDAYSTDVRPTAYFEHVITDDGTERHNVELVATPTMISGGNYVNLNVVTTLAGTAAAWVSSIYAKIIQGTTKRVNGYLCAAELEVINTNTNVSDWFVLVLNGNSTTNGQHSAYIACRSYGTAVLGNLFWLDDTIEAAVGTKSASSLFSTNVATVATHHIKVMIGATAYFIMLTNTAAT